MPVCLRLIIKIPSQLKHLKANQMKWQLRLNCPSIFEMTLQGQTVLERLTGLERGPFRASVLPACSH